MLWNKVRSLFNGLIFRWLDLFIPASFDIRVEGFSKGVITAEELKHIRTQITEETGRIKAKIGLSEGAKINLDLLDSKLDILTEIEDIIENGSYEEKVEALSIIGSNLTIESKKLNVTKEILYQVLQNGLSEAKAKNLQFEPKNSLANKDKTEVFASVCPTLLRG